MQEPTVFQVNFPLSQTTGGIFPFFRSNSAEEFGFRPIGFSNQFGCPTDLFPEDDVLSSPNLLFSDSPGEVSDSDLETELLNRQTPTNELHSPRTTTPVPPPPPQMIERKPINIMEKFPLDKVSDFKHVIYNLLVDHFNNPELVPFIEPVSLVLDGEVRTGFRFPESYNPDKRLPELYAQHIRRARLDLENQDSIFIQDLYKFYLRAVLELLAKYFEKCDKYTFLDDDAPLFVPGTSIKEAELRMKTMRTRARKRKSANSDAKKNRKSKRDW